MHTSNTTTKKKKKRNSQFFGQTFFSPTDEELESLAEIDFPQERCINYLSPDEAHEELRTAWQNRTYYTNFSILPIFPSIQFQPEYKLNNS